MRKDRAFVVVLLLLVFCVFVLINLFRYQVLTFLTLTKEENVQMIEAQRGNVLDNNGRSIASSVALRSIYFYTGGLKKEEVAFLRDIISGELKNIGRSASDIEKFKKDTERYSRHGGAFLFLERQTDNRFYDSLMSKIADSGVRIRDIRGKIYTIEKYYRYYPFPEIYAGITGYMDRDGKPLYGVEKELDHVLSGVNGKILLDSTPIIREGRWGRERFIKEVENGKDVELTIDTVIQEFTYRYLAESVKGNNAKSGCVIVMETNTGRIRAFVNYPSFNPNNYSAYDVSLFKNQGITDLFEAGSIIKPLVLGFILDQTHEGKPIFKKEDKIYCENGRYNIKTGSRTRTIEDVEKHKTLNLTEIMAHSSNIGMAKIMQKFEETPIKMEFYRFLISILNLNRGFNIPLSGHQKGRITHYDNWVKNYSLISFGMGYELSAPLLNYVIAFNSIPSGGKLVKPIIEKDAQIEFYGEDLFNSGTLEFLKKALIEVVNMGTARRAKSNVVQYAGKTGTARKYDPSKNVYSRERYISSFIGYFPADDPQFTIGVFVNEPEKKFYGSEVAVPVFKKIMERLHYYSDKKIILTMKEENK